MVKPIVVKAEDFDASKLTFCDPEPVNTGGRVNMSKIPILYDGCLLVLQTPVFKRCSVRGFDRKSDTDKVALIFYQSVKYADEEFYAKDVIGTISQAVKAHIKSNVRSLFQRKKDSVADLTFYDPVSEQADSIKTTVPTVSREDMTPAKEVRFYMEGKGEISNDAAEKLFQENNRTVSGRALVSVPYAYIINKQAYGLKNMLCSFDIRKKPEDKEIMSDGGSGSSARVDGSGLLDMGDAFC